MVFESIWVRFYSQNDVISELENGLEDKVFGIENIDFTLVKHLFLMLRGVQNMRKSDLGAMQNPS